MHRLARQLLVGGRQDVLHGDLVVTHRRVTAGGDRSGLRIARRVLSGRRVLGLARTFGRLGGFDGLGDVGSGFGGLSLRRFRFSLGLFGTLGFLRLSVGRGHLVVLGLSRCGAVALLGGRVGILMRGGFEGAAATSPLPCSAVVLGS